MWSLSKRLAAFCCASLTASVALLTADNAEYDYGSSYYNGASACCDESHWNFGAEFLYWKTHLDCLPSISSSSNHEIDNRKIGDKHVEVAVNNDCGSSCKYPRHKWKPGVRLNLGYKKSDCCWDLNTTWTYLYSKAHSKHNVESDQQLSSCWLAPVNHQHKGRLLGSHANSKWSLNYNTLEIGVGHTFTACECFVIRPHFDFKAVWIQQRVCLDIGRDYDFSKHHHSSNEMLATQFEGIKAKRNFAGVGPQIGCDLSWDLGCGWNLFGKAAGAILYARPKYDFGSKFGFDSSNSDIASASSHNNHYRDHDGHLVYNTSLGFGFGWNTWLCDNSYLVGLKLGWEHNLYFNQNGFLRPGNCSEGHGDLALYGLTAAISLDF